MIDLNLRDIDTALEEARKKLHHEKQLIEIVNENIEKVNEFVKEYPVKRGKSFLCQNYVDNIFKRLVTTTGWLTVSQKGEKEVLFRPPDFIDHENKTSYGAPLHLHYEFIPIKEYSHEERLRFHNYIPDFIKFISEKNDDIRTIE